MVTGNPEESVTIYGGFSGSWSQVVTLPDPRPDAGSPFGEAVAVFDGKVFVAAPNTEDVIIYENSGSGWLESDRISSSGKSIWATSLSVAGNTLAWSLAENKNVLVYEWQGDTWSLTGTLGTGEPRPDYSFRAPVVVSHDGSLILVGAGWIDGGRVFAYQKRSGEWMRVAEVLPPSGAKHFGSSLAIGDG